MKFLEMINVYKRFDDLEILKGVTLDFPKGKITAILGQSGTGKSVLIKNMVGIFNPDKGEILLEGKNILKLPEKERLKERRRFGYLFQDTALFDSMTVEENIAFPIKEVLGNKNKTEIRQIIEQKLDWIDLPGIEKKFPSELSGGMRKRVAFARTLTMDPDILLFDEPVTGLDPVLAESINNLILRVNKELNKTCIVISHDIIGSFKIADKIAFLADGKIQEAGLPEDIIKTDHPVFKKFLLNSFTDITFKNR